MEEEGKKRATAMTHLTAVAAFLVSTMLHHQSPIHPSYSSFSAATIFAEKRHVLLRFLLLSLRSLLRLLFLLLSPFLSLLASIPPPPSPSSSPTADTPAARALSHVLSVLTRVPVASRKYELVRSLAERLLDDNLRCCGLDHLNRAALSDTFSRALRRIEAAVSASTPAEGSLIAGVVRSGLRRWRMAAVEEEGVGEEPAAEKMAAELLWLAEKMAACGAAWEVVERWGAAAGLARLALSADPRIQVAFVRISVFLFKQANAKQVEELEEKEHDIAHHRMAMLTTWLPLLCRASNGTDTPVLSSVERSEMVRVLEELIQKLSWDQQEVVLALWLHHFTACSNSDWPNLESCYMHWYAESRKLFLKN